MPGSYTSESVFRLCFAVWGTVLLLGDCQSAEAQLLRPPVTANTKPAPNLATLAKVPWPVEWKQIPANYQERVARIIQSPTLTAVAKPEDFPSEPGIYKWLLDHPDRASLAWRRLGIAAVDIQPLPTGEFQWKDAYGSELVWRSIVDTPEGRIWYAEGKVKASQLLPLIPVKAVVVIRHGTYQDKKEIPYIRHQVEVFLQTDSVAASLIARLLGPAAPRMAEQGADQLLLFFSGISEYCFKKPNRMEALLAEKKDAKPNP